MNDLDYSKTYQINKLNPNIKYIFLTKSKKTLDREKPLLNCCINNQNKNHNIESRAIEINVSYLGDIENKFGIFKNKLSDINRFTSTKKEKPKIKIKLEKTSRMNFQNDLLNKINSKENSKEEKSENLIKQNKIFKEYNKICLNRNKPISSNQTFNKSNNKKHKYIDNTNTEKEKEKLKKFLKIINTINYRNLKKMDYPKIKLESAKRVTVKKNLGPPQVINDNTNLKLIIKKLSQNELDKIHVKSVKHKSLKNDIIFKRIYGKDYIPGNIYNYKIFGNNNERIKEICNKKVISNFPSSFESNYKKYLKNNLIKNNENILMRSLSEDEENDYCINSIYVMNMKKNKNKIF